jgi:hypothetical protein
MQNYLLIDDIDGIQKIITVYEGGGYFDSTKVLWDSRIDGPVTSVIIDPTKLGGWKRDAQNTFVFDPVKKSTSDAAVIAKQNAQTNEAATVLARKSAIKAVSSAATAADLKAVLVALIQHLGLDQ